MEPLPVLRALHIGAAMLLVGAWAFRLLLLPAGPVHADVARTLRRIAASAALVALASWVGWLASIAVHMSGLPPVQALAPDVLGTVAMQTTFGQVWLGRAGLLLLLAVVQRRATGSRGSAWLAFLLAAVALASLAGSGHALGAHVEHLLVDGVHALAAGVWLGMLPLLWWRLHRAVTTASPMDVQVAVHATRSFGAPGATAVIALGVTGALNAWWLAGSPGHLLESRYGLLVLAKAGLYLTMVSFALANRFVLVPRLGAGTPGALRVLRLTVLAECLAGGLALAAVGVLGVTPPAAQEQPAQSMQHGM